VSLPATVGRSHSVQTLGDRYRYKSVLLETRKRLGSNERAPTSSRTEPTCCGRDENSVGCAPSTAHAKTGQYPGTRDRVRTDRPRSNHVTRWSHARWMLCASASRKACRRFRPTSGFATRRGESRCKSERGESASIISTPSDARQRIRRTPQARRPCTAMPVDLLENSADQA